jgi:hypothetical protein
MGVLPVPPVPNRRETGARQCTPWPVSPVAPCSQGGHKGGRHMDGGWLRLHPQSLWRQSLLRRQVSASTPRAKKRSPLSTIARGPAPCQDLYRHVGYNSWPLAFLHICLDKEKDVSPALVPVTRQAGPTVPDTGLHHVESVGRQGDNPLANSSPGGDHCPQDVGLSASRAFAESPRVMLASPI